ncbi:MAG: inorganic phosphate transporter [Gelidibacter sp.]
MGNAFLIPLIVSPLMAAALSFIAYLFFRFFRKKSGITKSSCICVYEKQAATATENSDVALEMTSNLEVASCNNNCVKSYEGRILGISSQQAIDKLHYLSAGIVSFARGLNDTPKIVGLLLIINVLEIHRSLMIIAAIMAIGGLMNAKKVGVTMSKKITPMNSGQGFTANLITGLLVTTASIHGLPVSTTHVSVGSIFGIGTVTKKADYKMISKIVLSWILTLPVAAVMSAIAFKIFQSLI